MRAALAQPRDAAALQNQIQYLAGLKAADWVEECWIADNPQLPPKDEALKAWQAAIGAFRTVYNSDCVLDLERRAILMAIRRLEPKDQKRIFSRHPNVAQAVQGAPTQLELAA